MRSWWEAGGCLWPSGRFIGEGFDDALDVDVDGVIDGCDNCPGTANANQLDGDGDKLESCGLAPVDEPTGEGFRDTSDHSEYS